MPKKYGGESRLFQAFGGISWKGRAVFIWTTYSYPEFSFYANWMHVTQLSIFTFIQLWQISGEGDFASFSVKFPSGFKILLADSYSFTWLRREHEDHQVEGSFLCPGWKLLLHDLEGLNGHLCNVLCQYLVLKCVRGHWNVLQDPDGSLPAQHILWFWTEKSCFCQSTITC